MTPVRSPLRLAAIDRTDGRIAGIDRVRQFRETLQQLAYAQNKVYECQRCVDPLEALDMLRVYDPEGRCSLDDSIEYHTVQHAALGLFEYLNYRSPLFFNQCVSAIQTVKDECAARDRAAHGNGFVFCVMTWDSTEKKLRTGCHKSILSDYHNYVCGDEGVLTMNDIVDYAMDSDDPEQFLD